MRKGENRGVVTAIENIIKRLQTKSPITTELMFINDRLDRPQIFIQYGINKHHYTSGNISPNSLSLFVKEF